MGFSIKIIHPYPADFEACADRLFEEERTKHGIEEELLEASIPTDLLSLQNLWTQSDSAVEPSKNSQVKETSQQVVPAFSAAPSSQPVSSVAASIATAAAPTVVAFSSGVATIGSAINNVALYNRYPRRQRGTVERLVDKVPTPPKRRPSRQKKAKAAGTALS